MLMSKNEGFIIKIQGPVIDVRFPVSPPSIHEALKVETKDNNKLVLEVAFITGDNEVKALAMGPTDGLRRGMKVERTNAPIEVPTGPKTLGRIFNVLGQPIDGEKLEKGSIKHKGHSVFAGVGERTREGNDLWLEMKEAKVLDKTVMVFGQMNEPPANRLRVALTALTMAEYFRDEKKEDVLLFIDNVFRFAQAGSEVSALLGRMPSAVGYQPTLASEIGSLQERITSTKQGSITSVQAVYVPADDYTDPAPVTIFAHLDS